MKDTAFTYVPIGIIHSPHVDARRTPIQPAYAQGVKGRVEVFLEYAEGLRDLEGFSFLYLIYHFHLAEAPSLSVRPFLEDVEHGIFATRAPCRPNPIGLSVVRLDRRIDNVLYVDGIDVLDGTPLLDIKPYIMRFDHTPTEGDGWQDSVDEETAERRGRRGFRKHGTAGGG